MSGLGEIGELYGFVQGGAQVQGRDLDQYYDIILDNPSASASWLAAGTTAGTTPIALVVTNVHADWPRNPFYTYTGGTTGGTFVANYVDQFGISFTETAALGSTGSNQTVYGTGIAAKFVSGSFFPNTSIAGTYTIGFGTAANGSAQSNWFGLMTKIGGTADLRSMIWINNGTPTTLSKGTALGTLIDSTRHAFQGTSGVAVTDRYRLILKPSYDNSHKGTMCAF